MVALVFLAAVLGLPPNPPAIVDETGAPIGGATVTFVDARGATDVERSDSRGIATARGGFEPVRVRITAPGFAPATVALAGAGARIVLDRALDIIGSVRVATGSSQSLHALPVAASLMDRAAIANSGATSADGALRALPGFDRTRSNGAFTNYGQLRVSFGGAGNDRGLVLVDGVPAQDGFGGQVDWAAYPGGTIERAELLRGAGSALYGSGAVGGVLGLTTFGPNADASALPDGEVTFAAGTHGFSQQSLNARAAIAPRLTASFSAQQQRQQYFDFPSTFRSAIDDIAQSAASAAAVRFRYAASPSSVIEAGARGAWDDQQEGRRNYTFSRRLVQQNVTYLHPTARALSSVSFFARSAYVINVADQYPAKPGILRYVQDVPTTESGTTVAWLVDGGASTFEFRADGRWVRGESDQFANGGAFQNAGSGRQNLDGVALQETFRGNRFEFVAGARADAVTFSNGRIATANATQIDPARTARAVSPRLALRYDLSPRLAVRVSGGAGFRAPYLNELVRGFFIGNVAYEPNPALVPERSRTTSAGVDWTDGKRRISLDAAQTLVNDPIAFRTVDATHQLRSNLGQTRTDGATLTYAQSLGACSRLALSATKQHARVTAGTPDSIGKQLQFVPDESLALSYDGRIGTASVGATASYLGQTYADDLNSSPLGTAIVIGARLRLPLADGAAIVLSGDNLTSARYLSSVDRLGPPALVSLGFQLPIGPSRTGPTGDCSADRSVK
ncbi:MAG TPA: TonB-dependent receptor [Candidatus Baltobacteraceae bacterium]